MCMSTSNSVTPLIPEDTEAVLPSLDGYSSILVRTNVWSLFNLGTKYFVIDIGPKDFSQDDAGDMSNVVFKAKQSLSFCGFRPHDIFVNDNEKNLVFRISFMSSSLYCFPVLKGIRVSDSQGVSIGSVWRLHGCTCNDFVIKDSVTRMSLYATSKFNFCEGPDFLIKDNDGQTIAKVYRKGHQFLLRFGTNSVASTSTKIMGICFCMYLEVRGNLRFSNGFMRP